MPVLKKFCKSLGLHYRVSLLAMHKIVRLLRQKPMISKYGFRDKKHIMKFLHVVIVLISKRGVDKIRYKKTG